MLCHLYILGMWYCSHLIFASTAMMMNITPTYSFLRYHFALCYLEVVLYIVFIILCTIGERKLSLKKTGKREKKKKCWCESKTHRRRRILCNLTLFTEMRSNLKKKKKILSNWQYFQTTLSWVGKKKKVDIWKVIKNATLNMKIVCKNNPTLLFWSYRKYSAIFIHLWNKKKDRGITVIQLLCFLKVEIYNKIGIQFGSCCNHLIGNKCFHIFYEKLLLQIRFYLQLQKS